MKFLNFFVKIARFFNYKAPRILLRRGCCRANGCPSKMYLTLLPLTSSLGGRALNINTGMAPSASAAAEHQHHLSSCYPRVEPALLNRLVYRLVYSAAMLPHLHIPDALHPSSIAAAENHDGQQRRADTS